MREFRSSIVLTLVWTVLFSVDLFMEVAPETGFVTLGSVWLHYGAFALVICLLFLFSRRVKKTERVLKPTALLAIVFWAAGAYFVLSALFVFISGLTVARVLFAVLSILGSVWFFCTGNAMRAGQFPSSGTLGFGLSAASAVLLSVLLKYMERPASNQHFTLTVAISGCIFGLLFITALLRAVFLRDPSQTANLFWLSNVAVCFALCFAAQTIFLLIRGGFSARNLTLELPIMALGIVGAVVAKQMSVPPET